MATWATPGNGRASWLSAATSPTANTPLTPGTLKNGSTGILPARSVGPPNVFTTGEAVTPAVHRTVALGMVTPPATTPSSSTRSTLLPVRTFTPSLSSRLAALADKDSANVGRMRLPPSINTIDDLAG